MNLPFAVTASDGKKYLRPLARPLHAERPRVLRVEQPHRHDDRPPTTAPEPPGPLPADPRPGQAVLDVEPDRRQRGERRAASSRRRGPRVADLEDAEHRTRTSPETRTTSEQASRASP